MKENTMSTENKKIFDVSNVKQESDRIVDSLKKVAPWVIITISSLGGDEHVSMIIHVSLDEKSTWVNNYVENSRRFMMNFDCHGVLEQFLCDREIPKFRKRTVKNVDCAINKLVDYIKESI